jgi:hypothetical protein
MVNISLTEVPEYQVNSGRDVASKATGGVKSAIPGGQSVNQQGVQGVTKAPTTNSGASVSNTGAAKAATGGGVGTTGTNSVPNPLTPNASRGLPLF